ncbi:5-formyltetrahydrofolate cyclo-ligase [Lysobacter sp. D1-1-M9]|uniref:5-formyltetrahydrofolate cyclo-ligase n=1 Tax=Novilysobacter longmucuonensis TaxID=3098603 RepID=UPI002FC88947
MTADRMAHRRQLREALRARRRALPAAARIAAAERLATQLLNLPFAPQSGYVAGYWAMDGEIALHVWQLKLPRECIYCLPVLHDDAGLRFAPWRPGDALVSNRYGIPEPDVATGSLLDPDDLALAVMPLVGFDARGHRLGMGGGWYDRSFAARHHRPAPPWLVGAAFDTQHADALEPAEWDVTLDAVCTESRTYDCSSAPA